MLARLKRRRARRRLERRALAELAAREAAHAHDLSVREAELPAPTHTLSHIEGAWEVPVARLHAPGLEFAVATTADALGHPQLPAGTVFTLSSSSAEARLTGIERRGYAVVQAWPLAAPRVISGSAAYQRFPTMTVDRYVLCVLRVLELGASREEGVPPVPAPGTSTFDALA